MSWGICLFTFMLLISCVGTSNEDNIGDFFKGEVVGKRIIPSKEETTWVQVGSVSVPTTHKIAAVYCISIKGWTLDEKLVVQEFPVSKGGWNGVVVGQQLTMDLR